MTMTRRRRVVITGLGTINPCGITVAETWQNLLLGNSGINAINRFDTNGFVSQIAGQVKNFDPNNYIDKKEQKKMDLFIQYAVAASVDAINDSGLLNQTLSQEELEHFGVAIGSGVGGITTIFNESQNYRGPQYTSPFFIPSLIVNLASGFVSIRFGLKGPNTAVATACATGAHAVGDAARMIMFGYADRMIAGGTDSSINPLVVGGFSAMRALSTRNDAPKKASRPFDNNRDGFVISEGSGILVLEEYELAKARGAHIYAEIAGYGMSGDAYHIASPSKDADGPKRAIEAALKDASIIPEQIGYVNAHGTSTFAGDRVECLALKRVFGDHIKCIKISSTKSMTGHLLGAAGGLESIVCAMAVKTGKIPPTINIHNQDEECDIDVTANHASVFDAEYVLNNNFGFGGTNACLVFRKI